MECLPRTRPLSLHSTTSSRIALPPLLYTVLDSSNTLATGDTAHASVFKSVTVSTPTSPEQKTRIPQPLIEEVEVFPRATAASFTIAWSDILKVPPGAGRWAQFACRSSVLESAGTGTGWG
jgi:hypothetical protein